MSRPPDVPSGLLRAVSRHAGKRSRELPNSGDIYSCIEIHGGGEVSAYTGAGMTSAAAGLAISFFHCAT